MKHSYELMKVEQQGKLVAVYLIYIFIWLMKSLYCDEIAVWALQLITVRQHAVKSCVGTLIKHRHRLQDQLVILNYKIKTQANTQMVFPSFKISFQVASLFIVYSKSQKIWKKDSF